MNKLLPIAESIKQLLEKEFAIEAKYSFEVQKDWLLNTPSKELYIERWEEINQAYTLLVDDRWVLEENIKSCDNRMLKRKARIDIWFEEPYNFICEFDERQHFNQFRLKVFERLYSKMQFNFDLDHYIKLCQNRITKPGKSGFLKLKSNDPLFLEMYEGDNQDNRARQRVFRDFMKDITPELFGMNPTMRISYKVTNGKTKDFNSTDIESIERYLYSIDAFSKIKL